MIGSSSGDACPTCGARMALDQRYCLSCGNRRGDPRLPFMDAVTFMESSRQPAAAAVAAPPPQPPRAGISPSTTLIAGIATLVLAVGVGVLIGRSGDSGSAPVANQPPQIIKVGGSEAESGGGAEAEATSAGKGDKEAKKAAKSKGGGKKKAAPEQDVGASGTSKAAEEVLKPAADAKPLPPPTTKVGESCEKGTAGCSDSGEFNGSFFE